MQNPQLESALAQLPDEVLLHIVCGGGGPGMLTHDILRLEATCKHMKEAMGRCLDVLMVEGAEGCLVLLCPIVLQPAVRQAPTPVLPPTL